MAQGVVEHPLVQEEQLELVDQLVLALMDTALPEAVAVALVLLAVLVHKLVLPQRIIWVVLAVLVARL